MHVLGDVAPGARLLPGLAVVARAVGILELDHVAVIDVARARADADLPRSHAVGADGMGVHDPIGHVDLVAGLFDEVVAAEPAEQVPDSGSGTPSRPSPAAWARPPACRSTLK